MRIGIDEARERARNLAARLRVESAQKVGRQHSGGSYDEVAGSDYQNALELDKDACAIEKLLTIGLTVGYAPKPNTNPAEQADHVHELGSCSKCDNA